MAKRKTNNAKSKPKSVTTRKRKAAGQPESSTAATGNSGRDAGGRFAVGNRLSPGRRSAVCDLAYLKRFRQTVGLDEFGQMVAAILAIAMDPKLKASDRLKAAELIARYALPQPTQRVLAEGRFYDPDAASSENEFRVAGATPSQVDDFVLNRLRELVIEQRTYEASLLKQ